MGKKLIAEADRSGGDVDRIGIRDVAREAGVSLATVSRVLAGKSVRAVSRQAVEEALGRVDYRPNLAARRLRSQHSNTIGVVVSDITNPFFARMVRRLEDLAWKQSLRLLIYSSDEDAEREAIYLAMLDEEDVGGVVLAPSSPSGTAVRDYQARPLVLVDRAAPSGRADAVVLDNEGACRALVERLVANGNRELVGLFRASTFTGARRRQAFAAAIREAGLHLETVDVPNGEAETRSAVESAISRLVAATAVVAGDGLILIEAARALIPAQAAIALAGFDTGPWTPLLPAGTLVVDQPVEDMADQAFTLLRRRMADHAAQRTQIMIAGRVLRIEEVGS